MDISNRWRKDRKLTMDRFRMGRQMRLWLTLDDGDTEQVARGWVAKAVAVVVRSG
jgi:hypothetical protein